MIQVGSFFGVIFNLTASIGENIISIPGLSADSYKTCDIKIRIYHSCDATRFLEFCAEDGARLFRSSFYDRRLCRTVVLALPFLNGPGHENVRVILDGHIDGGATIPIFLSELIIPFLVFKNHTTLGTPLVFKYNIILLENSATTLAGSVMDYPSTVLRTYRDSKIYAEALNGAMRQGLLSEKCIIGIGFSLGAQLIGHVCRQLDRKCGQIYAVDAAGPLNVPGPLTPPHLRPVSRADGCHTVSLECNRWLLGTPWRQAHVNIIVNGGFKQPGCSDPLCSHTFCNRLLADVIRRPGACAARRRHVADSAYRLDLRNANSCHSCNNDLSEDFFMTTSKEPKCPS